MLKNKLKESLTISEFSLRMDLSELKAVVVLFDKREHIMLRLSLKQEKNI